MADKKQRILLAIGSARAGGAEGQLVSLGIELAARGHRVRFMFSNSGGSLTERLDGAGVPWSVARRSGWPRSSTLQRVIGLFKLAGVLVAFRPTVVMAWLPTAIWPALLLGRALTRAQLVAGIRGEIFDDQLGWQRGLLRRAFACAHHVTINSPHLAEVAQRWGVEGARVTLLPNGVLMSESLADPGLDPPVAVVVANYRWYKGHDTLVDALVLVREPVLVRLCGEGDRSAVADHAERVGVAHKLVFVEDPADVPAELAAAQFAIHPSTQEGLSNAILEELSAGLPVIACDVGGNPLLVDDSRGRLVPVSDPRALAAAIDDLSRDASTRILQGKAARQHALTFDWAACTDRYEALMSAPRGRR